jgi:hypothetical protein
MPAAVYVDFDAKGTVRQLNSLAKREFPFALAAATTDTAKDGQAVVIAGGRAAFELRSGEFIPRGVRITPARKSDVKQFGFAQADVHTAPRISSFMPHHVRGERRTPRKKKMAVPGPDLPKGYRTARGKVRRRYKPEELLKDWKGQYTGGRGSGRSKQRGKGKAFVASTRAGKPFIGRRAGRGRSPLEILWWLVDEAQIKPEWEWVEPIGGVVQAKFKKNFGRRLGRAIASSRGAA